jgi:hypothetical protein
MAARLAVGGSGQVYGKRKRELGDYNFYEKD